MIFNLFFDQDLSNMHHLLRTINILLFFKIFVDTLFMEIELAAIKQSADGQRYSNESDIISNLPKKQNILGGNKFWKRSSVGYKNISKSWYSLFLIINYIHLIYIYH
jgi:hypothetical protein